MLSATNEALYFSNALYNKHVIYCKYARAMQGVLFLKNKPTKAAVHLQYGTRQYTSRSFRVHPCMLVRSSTHSRAEHRRQEP